LFAGSLPLAGVTPCAIVAKRNADISVTVQKSGYGCRRRHRRCDGPQAESRDRDAAPAGTCRAARQKTEAAGSATQNRNLGSFALSVVLLSLVLRAASDKDRLTCINIPFEPSG